MKIKNIQQFRSHWRSQQGYDMPNWDENFIGSVHGEKSGFYKMVNGIVNNIKADLTPKLQNAQDEQAIYEFLQNAADSQSTECAVIYDENYFMVLNNGNTFTEKDLKALLNSFQGTKADKTKPENCGKIGRYGIGFKLAYRLIGKSDGADELLNDLAGPLLFSWHNNEQFQALLDYTGDSLELEDDVAGDIAPWLLKIILACFPTSPGENVRDLDYTDRSLFDPEELSELVSFLGRHRALLDNLVLGQGSLFFLKFGPKKHEKLKDSLLNIKSGIGYSMNSLKTLEKVILQDEIVAKYDAEFEHYSILPGTEDFKKIDPEFPSCPIEISLGFPTELDKIRMLKKAPSIYQFFPMRNERHSMAYFIHGTSFSKITDRTRLDDQGEANIETFKYITTALKRNLTTYRQEDYNRYVLIYKALLLTDRSEEYDAELINTHLYDPLLEFIQTNIPTNKNNFYLKDLVVVKNTKLPIEPMALGIGKEWLYWTDVEADQDIMRSAANNAKLGLKRWGLKELIDEGTPALVNNWLSNLSDADYKIFVEELKDVEFDAAFLEKFSQLKCFKFTDNQGNANFYAIDDLKNQEDIFLMSEQTLTIREAIKSLGFSVLEFNILDYAAVFQQLEAELDYLTNDKALFNKIVARTATASLVAEQKHGLFNFLKELKGVKKDELRAVRLFANQEGLNAPLNGLLPADAEVEEWLEGFKISAEEDEDYLAEYYIADKNKWEGYSNIIVPFWSALVKHDSLEDVANLTTFFDTVSSYYGLKSGQPKLSETNYIYVDSEQGWQKTDTVFYHKALANIENYESLRTAIDKVLGLSLPHPVIVSYLGSDPFRTPITTTAKEWKKELATVLAKCKEVDLNPAEKVALFSLFKEILTPKDLLRLELFTNNKGECTVLSKMLPTNTSVEGWLDDYKIRVEEDAEVLHEFMAKEVDIFGNIIQPEWTAITKHSSANSNIANFYKGVMKYAEVAKAPKSLTSANYVYINKDVGFVGADQVFYHSEMPTVSDYTALQSALHALTTLYAPHPDVLEHLQAKVMKTKDSKLGSSLKVDSISLEKGEVGSLLQFLDKTKEDFFTFLYVEEGENSRECIVGKRGKYIPYALEKGQQKLADKIQTSFGETYKLLPSKLYDTALRNKGLLVGSELFSLLSKSKDAPAELLSAIIAESSSTDVQAQVFSKIDKIVLKHGQTYGKDSIEHQALQIFRDKDADHSKARAKIYVEDAAGEMYKLEQIGFDANVTIAIDRYGKFSLPLAEVLPQFKAIQSLLDDILEQLVDYEAPTALKRRCFDGEEKSAKDVFSELKKEYQILENSNQLAYVLLTAKEANNNKLIKDFSVYTKAEEATKLGSFDAFHIKSNSFIADAAILDEDRYSALPVLLNLDGKYRSFEFGNQKLVVEPYISKKGSFYCTPIRSLEEEESVAELQKEVLEYLYEQWSAIDLEDRPTQLNLVTNEVGTLAGLALNTMVFPHDYALVKEQLPDWLVDWIGDAKEEVATVAVAATTKTTTSVKTVAVDEANEEEEVDLDDLFGDSDNVEEDDDDLDLDLDDDFDLDDDEEEEVDDLLDDLLDDDDDDLDNLFDGEEESEDDLDLDLADITNEEEEEQVEELEEVATTTTKVVPTGKLAFLKAIGVNTQSSELVVARHYFQSNEGEPVSQKSLNDLRNQEATYLVNTIAWLQSEATAFSSKDDRLYWLRKLYNTIDKITINTPLPYIAAVLGDDDEFIYKVDNHSDTDLYIFDDKQQNKLRERYNISISHVFDCLALNNEHLTNIEIKGVSLNTTKIECTLDIERLENNSQEWGAAHYIKWRESSEYSIYLYNGQMPYNVHFLDKVVKAFEDGNAVVHGNIAYVNSQSTNIEEDLFAIASKSKGLTENSLLGLLRYKNEGVEEAEHKVIERVVETVVVEEELADNEEVIESPTVDAIKEYKEQNTKGELKVAFDINELPEEVLEQLMQYAKKARVIVEKNQINKT